MGWLRRLRRTISGSSADFDEETRFHFDQRVDEYVGSGMSRDEAKREAARRLGNLTLAREQTGDADTLRWLADFGRDVRYAGRTLTEHPAFAAIAVLTLGLGIGLNTAMFTFTDALIFRPADLPKPRELVRIVSSTKDVPVGKISYPDYLDLQRQSTTLSGLVAFDSVTLPISRNSDDARQVVGGAVVSGNYFSVLGVRPALGRTFLETDDRLEAGAVAIISRKLWERTFQSDPEAIGREMSIGSRTFTVIGVVPEFTTADLIAVHPDVYLPIARITEVASSRPVTIRDDRSAVWLTLVGRLRPGVTAAAANAEVSTLASALEQAYPATNRQRLATAMPEMTARKALNPERQQAAALLLGIAGLVLLIACANVANLLLSHAAGRNKEIGIRLALGASRTRVVRQLLAESFLLACGGGAVGLALAYLGVRYLSVLVQSILSAYDVQPLFDVRVDGRMLLFTVLASLTTIMVFGLVPALRSTNVDLVSALTASASRMRNRRRRWTPRGVLVASQATVSMIVLAIAGLSIQQFVAVSRADPGFRTDRVLLVTFDPGTAGYSQRRAKEFFDRIVARTHALPGVSAAGLTQDVPLISGFRWTPLTVDGFDMTEGHETLSIRSFVVDPGYWAVMRTPLVRGRIFSDHDTSTSPRVVVVNETMARQYWPNRDALGGTVRLDRPGGPPAEVVGVVADGKYGNIAEQPQPVIFIPFAQKNNESIAMTMTVLVSGGDEAGLAAPIRAEAKALDASLPAFNIRSLQDVYEKVAIGQQALVSQLMIAIGSLGMTLTIVGLYGVVAYLTTLRTREIGIRMALGAGRPRILTMVLKQAAVMMGAGLAVGVGVAYLLTPAFAFAFNFAAHDAAVLAAAASVLTATALAASSIPARRAAMVNPTVALRHE